MKSSASTSPDVDAGTIGFPDLDLVALGSQSAFLPLLVLVIGISSLLFVDWLEWFALHHVLAYCGMILGTVIALADYFRNAGADTSKQLCAIASLLIYPELVIMLQRKNLRLFEQMAIFLLLEIIVAALVNDNVLFGILLAPIVVLWVASLLLFTRYAALIQLAPDLDKPTPRFIELIMEAWSRARARHQLTPTKMLEVVQPKNAPAQTASFATLVGQVWSDRCCQPGVCWFVFSICCHAPLPIWNRWPWLHARAFPNHGLRNHGQAVAGQANRDASLAARRQVW